MFLKDIKSDILNIIDVKPSWLERLSYNPISDIVTSGKTYHILYLLEDGRKFSLWILCQKNLLKVF